MNKVSLIFAFTFLIGAFSGIIDDDNQLFAQYPAPPVGCCKQRDWLAGDWRETEIGFDACEELNRNRDNLDDIFEEKGYVWWDDNCTR